MIKTQGSTMGLKAWKRNAVRLPSSSANGRTALMKPAI
jgi:hypothetical protein